MNAPDHDTSPAPAPEYQRHGDASALSTLRAAVDDALREKLAAALNDPLVCWWILRTPEERAQIVQCADAWAKEHVQ